MRRRRFERCVLRAEVALEAGFPEDAKAALEEARQLDPHASQIAEVEALIAAALPAQAAQSAARYRRYGRYAAIAATAILVSAGGGWGVQSYLSRTFSSAGNAADTPITVSGLGSASVQSQPNARESAASADESPRVQVRTEQVVVGAVGIFGSDPNSRNRPDARLVTADPVIPAIAPPQDLRAAAMPDTPPVQTAERTISPPPVEPVTNIPDEAPRPPSLAVSTLDAAPLPASSTAAPPAAPIDERGRVRSVLARYEAAYSNLDAQAAQAVWPNVDRSALARAFGTLQAQKVSLDRCDVNLSGAIARANCSGSASWTPKVGSGRTESRRWDFTLQNSDGTWKIVAAQAR